MSQSRRWCFTLNNPLPEDEVNVSGIPHKYLIFGREVGDNGTPHLQGFIVFKNNKRLSACKKLISRAHWEITQGSSQQAADYCKKDGDFLQSGIMDQQGKRNDLSAAIATAKDSGLRAVAEEHPECFVKYHRGLRDLLTTLNEEYTHNGTRGLWIWGPPGSGKTHAARGLYPDEEPYMKAQNKWFDGYNGEAVIILDDLDTTVLGHHLKRWSDKWPVSGETKGGTVQLRHKLFVITSNYPIEHFAPDDEHLREALSRRFTVIHKTDRLELINALELIT